MENSEVEVIDADESEKVYAGEKVAVDIISGINVELVVAALIFFMSYIDIYNRLGVSKQEICWKEIQMVAGSVASADRRMSDLWLPNCWCPPTSQISPLGSFLDTLDILWDPVALYRGHFSYHS